MNNLFTYVSAMKEELDGLSIIERAHTQQTTEEDGILTENSELLVTFNNGVGVRVVLKVSDNKAVSKGCVCHCC